jgi:hypothetical protein
MKSVRSIITIFISKQIHKYYVPHAYTQGTSNQKRCAKKREITYKSNHFPLHQARL